MTSAENGSDKRDNQPQAPPARAVERRKASRGAVSFGLMLALIGAILLVNNIVPGLGFGKLWPAFIIAWGFTLLITSFIPPFNMGRLLSGLFVGTIGVLFLYNALGFIPFSVWANLISLWPVILIAIGFSILSGAVKSRILAAIPVLLILGAVIAAFFYQDAIFSSRRFVEHSLERERVAAIRDGEAVINFGAGNLQIGSTEKLYDIHAREYRGAGAPQVDFSRGVSGAELTIRPRQINAYGAGQRTWRVLLSRDARWRLDINSGVSDMDCDLRDLQVAELELDGGVGDTTVRFGDRVDRVEVDINAGVSSIKVLVPEGVGVQVNANRGLSTLRFEEVDVERDRVGDRIVYRTPEFREASKTVEINADIGVSSLIIERH